MSEQEVQQRKGKLIEDYVAAKTKVQMLREDARREAKVLDGLVEYLRTGGERGQTYAGMPPETYLAAHSILARSASLQPRPYTFAQTCP